MLSRIRFVGAFGIAVMLVTVAGAAPARAITADLAKKCRELAIKAHPYKLPGVKGPGSAEPQRDYFNTCVAKGGNMPPEPPSAGQTENTASPAGSTTPAPTPTSPPAGPTQAK
jgi:hypothetical protein